MVPDGAGVAYSSLSALCMPMRKQLKLTPTNNRLWHRNSVRLHLSSKQCERPRTGLDLPKCKTRTLVSTGEKKSGPRKKQRRALPQELEEAVPTHQGNLDSVPFQRFVTYIDNLIATGNPTLPRGRRSLPSQMASARLQIRRSVRLPGSSSSTQRPSSAPRKAVLYILPSFNTVAPHQQRRRRCA